MNECAFADASRPARCVIAKMPLLDYSIGHELILLQKRNALLLLSFKEFNGLKPAEQVYALIEAVLTCSRTWLENQQPFRWFGIWKWRSRNTDWPLAIAEFRNYRLLGSTLPATKPPGGEGEPLNVPHLARVLFATGLNLDLPLGFAQWIYCAEMERLGHMKIKGEMDAEIDRLLEEIRQNPRGSVNIAQKKAREAKEAQN